MKGNAVYKRAFNGCLALLSGLDTGARLPSEADLVHALNVSRTTVRAVLSALTQRGILTLDGPHRRLIRRPEAGDYFPDTQTLSAGAAVERRFMQWILQGDFRAGQLLNSAELARQFGTSTTTIREYLTHFQHYGLLERRPNSAWVYKGLTPEFADEIFDVREMFELRSTRDFLALPVDGPEWKALDDIEARHHLLLAEIETRHAEFPALDEALHRLIHMASGNRFIIDFYEVISAIFHYTYQWNEADEQQRSQVALNEHLAYIAALRSRDPRAIEARCRAHLKTARATLIRSIRLGPFGA